MNGSTVGKNLPIYKSKKSDLFSYFWKGGGQTSKHSLLCLLCKCIELGDFYVREGQLISSLILTYTDRNVVFVCFVCFWKLKIKKNITTG